MAEKVRSIESHPVILEYLHDHHDAMGQKSFEH
jgi:hypothetical protein